MPPIEFSKALAKRIQGLKKEIGATRVSQGYKGTGGQSHRRQIFVRLSNDKPIDLWIEKDSINLGGIYRADLPKISTEDQNLDRIFAEICTSLKTLM